MNTFTRAGHEGAKFFIGGEVEQTPAFGKKTLFVVGLQDTLAIISTAKSNNIQHIFLSANRSFDSVALVDDVYMVGDTLAADWATQLETLINKGYTVSLDYPAHKHVDVLKIISPAVWQSRNFIPVLSVAVPHVTTSNINLTIKIDDINFGATNPGVWCINHHEITDSNRFTSWDEYASDEILNVLSGPAADTPETPAAAPKGKAGKTMATAPVAAVAPAPVAPTTPVQNDNAVGLDTEVKPLIPETPADAPVEDVIKAISETVVPEQKAPIKKSV